MESQSTVEKPGTKTIPLGVKICKNDSVVSILGSSNQKLLTCRLYFLVIRGLSVLLKILVTMIIIRNI